MRKERLRMIHVKKTGRAGVILQDVSLNLYEGEVLGLLGLHDAGKTTLLDILSGGEPYDGGMVFFNEERAPGRTVALGSRVGIVRRRSALAGNMTVAENIFVLRRHRRYKLLFNQRMVQSQTRLQLRDLDIGIEPRDLVSTLSDAQRYIVEIVKAYILGAELILIDDFSKDYPQEAYAAIGQVIDRLKGVGVSFLIAGSQFAYLDRFCDRIAILAGRRIAVSADKDRQRDRAAYEAVLSGRTRMEEVPLKRAQNDGEVLLRAEDLTCGHLDACSFEVRAGEIVALMDPRKRANEALLSLVRDPRVPHGGRITLMGRPLNAARPDARAYCTDFQLDKRVFANLSLRDNILMPCRKRFCSLGVLREKRLRYIEGEFSKWYGDADIARRENCARLSEREKMAVYLFCLRMRGIRLLFCVDPLQSTDVVTNQMIMGELRAMAERGAAVCILMTSFDQDPAHIDRVIHIPYR